jgi:hypothetical protein
MKTFISLGLAASFAGLSFAQNSDSDSTTLYSEIGDSNIKRDFLTCEDTYGGGSITCGNSTSRYCYDPTLGEVRPPPNIYTSFFADIRYRTVAPSTTATAKLVISAPPWLDTVAKMYVPLNPH